MTTPPPNFPPPVPWFNAPAEPPAPPPAPKRRKKVIVLSIVGGLVVIAGAVAGLIAATGGGSSNAGTVQCPGGYYAAPGHCGSATPQDTTTATTPALSGADETFVTDMRSTFNFGSSIDDQTIANFGEAVCGARQAGSSQATEIGYGQSAWTNTPAGQADHMVRLAEQDICPSELPADTVTYIVTGTAGAADVTYGPSGSNSSGQVPMSVTQDVPSSPPSFYAINAQLQGGGQVSCEIQIDGVTISSGSASGGYNIASCEISNINGGWVNDNSAG